MKAIHLMTFALLLFMQQAFSHPMPSSNVDLHILKDTWELNLELPDHRLETALKSYMKGNSEAEKNDALSITPALVEEYILKHINISSKNNPSWQIKLDGKPMLKNNDTWIAKVIAMPASDLSDESVRLDYKVIVGKIVTHSVFVNLVEDWRQENISPERPQLLGKLRASRKHIDIAMVN